ncbi:DgyrCDS11743 [Dimorphilus gyrociliatus]|uniref:DgyrCDS11743 n=1 Tax=Dimorphilus gyrociliatus TaxID=2664684 RepID=A0A7I8W5L3_9ANNE|nr:DgyrCDS11743 [Dimorphilus gyrociliatus]
MHFAFILLIVINLQSILTENISPDNNNQDLELYSKTYFIEGVVKPKSLAIKEGAKLIFQSDQSRIVIENELDYIEYIPLIRNESVDGFNDKTNVNYVKICREQLHSIDTIGKLASEYLGYDKDRKFEIIDEKERDRCCILECLSHGLDIRECVIKYEKIDYPLKIKSSTSRLRYGIVIKNSKQVFINHFEGVRIGLHIFNSRIELVKSIKLEDVSFSKAALLIENQRRNDESSLYLSNIHVKNNSNFGLYIDFPGKVHLSKFSARKNKLAGIFLTSTVTLIQPSGVITKLNDLDCLTCDSNLWHSIFFQLNYQKPTKKILKARSGDVIYVEIYKSNNPINITIRDGKDENSPIILHNCQWTSDKNIRLESTGQYLTILTEPIINSNKVIIFLKSVKPKSTFTVINHGETHKNDYGLIIYNLNYPIYIKNLDVDKNNENGLSIYNPIFHTIIRHSRFTGNEKGLRLAYEWGSQTIENSTFSSNKNEAIDITKEDSEQLNSNIKISNNTLNNHKTHTTIHIETKGVSSVNIENNKFINGRATDIKLKNHNDKKSKTVNFIVRNNRFSCKDATKDYIISCNGISSIEIMKNIVENSKKGFLRIMNRLNESSDIYIRDNTVKHCLIPKHIIDIGRKAEFNNRDLVRIKRNSFIGNYPREIDHSNKQTAIIVINVYDIRINENIFDNYKFDRELTLPNSLANSEIIINKNVDARENYWRDVNVLNCVDGHFSSYNYRGVLLSPIYLDKNLTILKDISLETNGKERFEGDFNSDIIITSGEYRMTRNCRILKRAKVTIQPGVVIRASPNTGIEVYGQLEILGTPSSRVIIKLDSAPDNDTVNIHRDSRVEIIKSKESMFVCYTNDESIAPFKALCKAAGYGVYEKHSFKFVDNSVNGWKVECTNDKYDNCIVKKAKCTDGYLTLRCGKQQEWSGINYLINSKSSIIQGLTLIGSGRLGHDLFFELFQHELKDIRILSKSSKNLLILQSKLENILKINDLEIYSTKVNGKTIINALNVQFNGLKLFNTKVVLGHYRKIDFLHYFNRDEDRISNIEKCPKVPFYIKRGEQLILRILIHKGLSSKCNLEMLTQKNNRLMLYIFPIRYNSRKSIGWIEDKNNKYPITSEPFNYLAYNRVNVILNSGDYIAHYIIVNTETLYITLPRIENNLMIQNSSFKSNGEYVNYIEFDTNFNYNIDIKTTNFTYGKYLIYSNRKIFSNNNLTLKYSNIKYLHHISPKPIKNMIIKDCHFKGTHHPFHIHSKEIINYPITIEFLDNYITVEMENPFKYGQLKFRNSNKNNCLIRIINNRFNDKRIYQRKPLKNYLNLNVDCQIRIEENRFINFHYYHSILHIKTLNNHINLMDKMNRRKDVIIKKNSFENINNISNCIEFHLVRSSLEMIENNFTSCLTSQSILNLNIFDDNRKYYNLKGNAIVQCSTKHLINIAGNIIPIIELNNFNSVCKFYLHLKTICPIRKEKSCIYNIPYNYWGSRKNLYERFYDGNYDSFLPRLDPSPIYLTENFTLKTQIENLNEKYRIHLSGYIQGDYLLKNSIVLTGNVIIEDNLEISRQQDIEIIFKKCHNLLIIRGRLTFGKVTDLEKKSTLKFTCLDRKDNLPNVYYYQSQFPVVFDNLIIKNVNFIFMGTPPPKIENCIFERAHIKLIRTFGENDNFTVKNAKFTSSNNGKNDYISLVQNRHDTIIENSHFKDGYSAVRWSSDNKDSTYSKLNWPTLFLCIYGSIYEFSENDYGLSLDVEHLERYNAVGCSTEFISPINHIIKIIIETELDDRLSLVKIYDELGNVLVNGKLRQAKTIIYSETRKIKIELNSKTNYHSDFKLFIQPVKESSYLCTFEGSNCEWKIPNILPKSYSYFNRIQSANVNFIDGFKYDATYPSSTNGHYFAMNIKSEGDILAIPEIYGKIFDSMHNLCYFKMYAYSSHPNQVLLISVDIFDAYGPNLHLKTIDLTNDWKLYRIRLKIVKNRKFRLIIKTSSELESNIVIGIDNTDYEECRNENKQVQITDTTFSSISEESIQIINKEYGNSIKIILEKLNFNIGFNSIDINVYNALILIRNSNLTSLDYLNLQFNSDKRSKVIYTQNEVISDISKHFIFKLENNGNGQVTSLIEKSIFDIVLRSTTLISIRNTYLSLDNNLFEIVVNGPYEKTIINHQSPNYGLKITNCIFLTQSKIKIISSRSRKILFNNNIVEYGTIDIKLRMDEHLSLQRNWWGTRKMNIITKRIIHKESDKNLRFALKPIFEFEPNSMYLSVGCPIKWFEYRGYCFYYHLSPASYEVAYEFCDRQYSTLLTRKDLIENQQLSSWIKYKHFNGFHINDIWTLNGRYKYKQTASWICKRKNSGICPFNCFKRGTCSRGVCHCHSGWEGTYCTKFTCKQIENCSNHGSCTGPNECKCNPGWHGPTCGQSKCSRYSTCYDCTRNSGCGWCDSIAKCMPGNPKESFFDCKNHSWFYRSCLTLSTGGCSKFIQKINCEDYCRWSESSLCKQCREFETCFNLDSLDCSPLNESLCPGGIPKFDFYGPFNKLNSIKLNENLISIDDDKLYRCNLNAKQHFNGNNYEILIIPRIVEYERGSVIYSSKISGIMHKVIDYELKLNNYTLVYGEYILPYDLLNSGHYKFDGNVINKFNNIYYSGKLITNDDIDKLKMNLKEYMYTNIDQYKSYKIIGKDYLYKGERIVYSYYLITKYNKAKINDILISKTSKGFLEEIENKRKYKNIDLIIETKFLNGINGVYIKKFNNISELESKLTCDMNNNKYGLYYLNYTDNLNEYDLVVNKKESPLLSIVKQSKSIGNNWYLIELIDLFTIPINFNNQQFNWNDYKIITDENAITDPSTFAKRLNNTFILDDCIINLNGKLTEFFNFGTEIRVLPYESLIDQVKLNVQLNFSFKLNLIAIPNNRMETTVKIDRERFGYQMRKYFTINFLNVDILGVIDLVNVDLDLLEGLIVGKVMGNASISIINECFLTFAYRRGNGLNIIDNESSFKLMFANHSGEWNDTMDLTASLKINFNIKWPYLNSNQDTLRGRNSIYKWQQDAPLNSIENWLKRIEESSLSNDNSNRKSLISIERIQEINYKCYVSRIRKTFVKKFTISTGLSDIIGKFEFFNESDHRIIQLTNFGKTLQDKNADIRGDKWKSLCPFHYDKSDYGMFGLVYEKYNICLHTCTCPNGEYGQTLIDGECSCCPDGTPRPFDNLNFECPCICPNGRKSTTGPKGCRCKSCKVCPDGRRPPIGPDGSCLCDNECGIDGLCTLGRTGLQCDQPSCHSLNNCNGHGVCLNTNDCGSYCACFPNWIGPSCAIREHKTSRGSPSLETLDGKSYEFFSIGQFWGCISNVISYQLRFFGYKTTSFIGAIAIRLGKSDILTVNGKLKAKITEPPTIKLNGKEILSEYTNKFSKNFKNTGFVLDIDMTENEHIFTIISITHFNGSVLSVIADYSPKMNRQYLTVSLLAGVDMMNNTKGLCGVMNDNTADDFMGRNGTIFTSVVDFIESWRIAKMSRENGGLANSWSEIASNFHYEDRIDPLYVNSNHLPRYILDNIDDNQYKMAENLCETAKLMGKEKMSCVYNVIISGEVNIAKHLTYKLRDCRENCSLRGECYNGKCICMNGWSSDVCNERKCVGCSNGICSVGFCRCNPGYEGPTCDYKADCIPECKNGGLCVKSGLCKCTDGWTSPDCSVKAHCSKECLNGGICVDNDICKCPPGYNGTSCENYSCELRNWCSGHGMCIDYDKCLCFTGWKGLSCSKPLCPKDCSGRGKCLTSGECDCNIGYEGSDCSFRKACSVKSNCYKNGICKSDDECLCDYGYSTDCEKESSCQLCPNGLCQSNGNCECSKRYFKKGCFAKFCEIDEDCYMYGGACVHNCHCASNWIGEYCEIPSCSGVGHCSGNGFCIRPDDCVCNLGYEGETCSIKSLNDSVTLLPSSDKSFSRIIDEHFPEGEIIMTVAIETDNKATVKNNLRYSMNSHSLPLEIDGEKGILRSTGKLTPGNYQLKVDVYYEMDIYKSTSLNLNLTILDVNECPIIKRPENGEKIFIDSLTTINTIIYEIEAYDGDYGINSRLIYDLDINGNNGSVIGLEIKNSSDTIITNKNPLNEGRYDVNVIVHDNSIDSCSSRVSFEVIVFPPNLKKESFEKGFIKRERPKDKAKPYYWINKKLRETTPYIENDTKEIRTITNLLDPNGTTSPWDSKIWDKDCNNYTKEYRPFSNNNLRMRLIEPDERGYIAKLISQKAKHGNETTDTVYNNIYREENIENSAERTLIKEYRFSEIDNILFFGDRPKSDDDYVFLLPPSSESVWSRLEFNPYWGYFSKRKIDSVSTRLWYWYFYPFGPIYKTWESWQSWNIICDKENTMTRYRYCFYYDLKHRLREIRCPYYAFERKFQYGQFCSINGGWSTWGQWDTCKTKFTRRRRLCDNPFPRSNGKSCSGSRVERKLCIYEGVDGKWSQWEQLSDCYYPDYRFCKAKLGFRKIVRYCSAPKPIAPGKNCIGQGVKIEECAPRQEKCLSVTDEETDGTIDPRFNDKTPKLKDDESKNHQDFSN